MYIFEELSFLYFKSALLNILEFPTRIQESCYLIDRVSDFELIPELSFGGSITDDQGVFFTVR